MSEHNAPHDTAASLGILPATLRRWCAYHAAHLSTGANPPAGTARRFDGRDLEVLRTVRDLRAQGLTVASINEQLAKTTFAVVDDQQPPDSEQQAIVDQPEPPQAALLAIVPQDYLMTLERRLVAVEAREHRLLRDAVFVFMAGVVCALVGMLIVIEIILSIVK